MEQTIKRESCPLLWNLQRVLSAKLKGIWVTSNQYRILNATVNNNRSSSVKYLHLLGFLRVAPSILEANIFSQIIKIMDQQHWWDLFNTWFNNNKSIVKAEMGSQNETFHPPQTYGKLFYIYSLWLVPIVAGTNSSLAI